MKKRVFYHYGIISFANIFIMKWVVGGGGGGGGGGCGSVVHVMDYSDALPGA